MDYYALIAGTVTAAYVVIRFRTARFERRRWAYPALLATFPVYYWVFALHAADAGALINEIGAGLPFLLVACVAYRTRSGAGTVLLAAGYVLHAGYDVIHDALFLNPGTPAWWPEFCGAVDVVVGVYLLYRLVAVNAGTSGTA